MIRRVVRDLPHRLRDAAPDLVERISGADPLPPPRLRARVGLSSSRREFRAVGEKGAKDVLGSIARAGCDLSAYPRWLDLGCGCGRIARYLGRAPSIRRLSGVDVDREAIGWCREHLPGDYTAISPSPPLSMASASLDVVCAVSVFTHMDEATQRAWLEETHRLLRAGGLLVVSTHSPDLTWTRPDLTADQHRRLAEDGFLFAPAIGPFNDSSTFQSEDALRRKWSASYGLRLFERFGLGDFQDLSVWERLADPGLSGRASG